MDSWHERVVEAVLNMMTGVLARRMPSTTPSRRKGSKSGLIACQGGSLGPDVGCRGRLLPNPPKLVLITSPNSTVQPSPRVETQAAFGVFPAMAIGAGSLQVLRAEASHLRPLQRCDAVGLDLTTFGTPS